MKLIPTLLGFFPYVRKLNKQIRDLHEQVAKQGLFPAGHYYSPIPEAQDVLEHIKNTCKKAYTALNLDGYARFDIRLTPENEVYIIEVNANPELAKDEDFASSAIKDGMTFENLVEKIINLGKDRARDKRV